MSWQRYAMTGWAYCNVVESRSVRLSVPATKLCLLATIFGWSVPGGAWEGRRELRSAEIFRDFATNLLQRWLLDWNVNFPMAIQAQTASARWGGFNRWRFEVGTPRLYAVSKCDCPRCDQMLGTWSESFGLGRDYHKWKIFHLHSLQEDVDLKW